MIRLVGGVPELTAVGDKLLALETKLVFWQSWNVLTLSCWESGELAALSSTNWLGEA
jgi:hypothetical protein